VIQLSEQFVPIKLDAEKGGKPAAEKYGVHGYPTILFVDGDGNVVVKTGGYMPPKDFSTMLNRVLDLKHMPEWEATLKSDPGNVDAISKLGIASALKGDEAAATDYATKAMTLAPSNPNDEFDDLYNAVGDLFQNGNKPDKAITFFDQAAKTGKDTNKVAYALLSESYCYLMTNEGQKALDAANKALALPGLSKDDQATAAGLQKAANNMIAAGVKKPLH
jgi:tetratricopeptide (TPR) repeat protein